MSKPDQNSQRGSFPLPPIALVHDWLTGMRGGEKVLQALCRHYVDAPIWTLLYTANAVSETIAEHEIHTSLLQKLPGAAKHYRSYLPLFPLLAEMHKANASSLIISTSHAVAKAMVKRGRNGPLHVCYIHTPMRYAWDLFEEYFGVERKGWIVSRLFYLPIMRVIRLYDSFTTDRVDLFIANSTYIADRVRRTYGRVAEVIPPPVDVHRFFSIQRRPEEWYLVVSALVPYKRVADTIHACNQLGKGLKIIGSGPEYGALATLARSLSANVEMLGSLTDDEVADHYGRAKALLFPGIEDFGIVPVEAIAAGCPVIAFASGGILDSMTPRTALLYYEQTISCLRIAIDEFEGKADSYDTAAMREHASCFAEDRFIERITAAVSRLVVQRATEEALR